jgi:hypothetical protein
VHDLYSSTTKLANPFAVYFDNLAMCPREDKKFGKLGVPAVVCGITRLQQLYAAIIV